MLEECLVRIVGAAAAAGVAVVRVLVAAAGGDTPREGGLATTSGRHRRSPHVAHLAGKREKRGEIQK